MLRSSQILESERHEITPFPEQSYAAGQRRSEAITRIQNQSIRRLQPAASQQLLIMHSFRRDIHRIFSQAFYNMYLLIMQLQIMMNLWIQLHPHLYTCVLALAGTHIPARHCTKHKCSFVADTRCAFICYKWAQLGIIAPLASRDNATITREWNHD